jgi:hypothetical protein
LEQGIIPAAVEEICYCIEIYGSHGSEDVSCHLMGYTEDGDTFL